MEKFLENIAWYVRVKADYDKAAENCEYDRGYWLHNESGAIDSAKKALQESLDSMIDERVEQRLIALGLVQSKPKCSCDNRGKCQACVAEEKW